MLKFINSKLASVNYPALNGGVLCEFIIASLSQAGSRGHYPLSSRIRGLLYTNPYGLSSLTAVMGSLYSASSEYSNLTHSPPLAYPPFRKESCKQQGDKMGDPKIAEFLKEAKKIGVEIRGICISLLPTGEVILEDDNLAIEV